MTTQEFSVGFDNKYNNIKSQSAPGLDEYEKSFFLTEAQEELVKGYFNPLSNPKSQGFDGNEKRQVDFAELLKVADITANVPTSGSYISIDSRAQLFLFPTDTFIVTNERIQLTEGGTNYFVTVVPLNYKEYDRLMSKLYKEPLKNQCWRFMQSNSSVVAPNGQSIVSEIISKSGTVVSDYRVRYVKKPKPIILADLTTLSLSIDGVTAVTECELNPIIHRDILDRAVELAKGAYEDGSLQAQIQLNQRNE